MHIHIPLTPKTIPLYKRHLEKGSYEKDTYATNKDRMVTFINPDRNSPYRYHLRTTDGRYLSKAKTTDEAIQFLLTGEYIDCYDHIAQRW